MEILDGTIVVTSAPQIGSDLGVSSSSVSLVITAYLVTVAALIPQSGWMASRLGPRRVFLSAIALFTVASLGCALSPSLPVLVAMRVLQGVGAAMMVPVGRLEVLADVPKSELMRVISFLVWPALLAPVIAPLAGGLITTYASWHWIFLINLPLGVFAFAVAWRLIEPRPVSEPPPLDRIGLLLTVVGLAALTYTAQLLADPAQSSCAGRCAGRRRARPAGRRGPPPAAHAAAAGQPADSADRYLRCLGWWHVRARPAVKSRVVV